MLDRDNLHSGLERYAVSIVRRSFEASQGNQAVQVDVVMWGVKDLLERGVAVMGEQVRQAVERRVRGVRLPPDHVAVAECLRLAQLMFWTDNFFDIADAAFAENAELLPDAGELAHRVESIGKLLEIPDIWGLSSFKPQEMKDVNDGLASYRANKNLKLTSHEVMVTFLLPRLLKVERRWQDRSSNSHHIDGGRPGAKSDRFMSKLLHNCQVAMAKRDRGQPMNLGDRMYLAISQQLDQECPDSELFEAYEALLEAYNANHPDKEATALHK